MRTFFSTLLGKYEGHKLLLSLLLLCSIPVDQILGQTMMPTCGVYQKFGGLPKGYHGPVITDRFENQYTLEEIQNLPEQLNTCSTVSIFDLHFIPSGTY